jgi:DNA gyrase subunit B
MDEQMKKNILEYHKQIKTISSFVEAVRKTVGQYLGYTGNRGFLNMFREIFQNGLDEMMKEDSPCNYMHVSYDERDHRITVIDNGRGIPFGHMIRIFTSQHTSSNYEKKEGEFSSGRHGVGSKVTNAVSSSFIVESYNSILKEARRVEFYDGKPWDKGEVEIPNKGNKQGTMVTFTPCYEVMGQITTTYQEILNLIQMLLPLLKIGAVIDFVGIDINGKTYKDRLVNEDGIVTDLINKTTNPLIKPIILSNITGKMKADIAFTYDSDDLGMEQISSFGNFCPTISGTHVDGFIEGLTKFFREYMNKIYLTSNKLVVVNNDIKTGLKAIVSVAHLEPIFTGQAKEILSNEDMFYFTKNLLLDGLAQWIKENPNDVKKLCKYFKDVAEVRVKSDATKMTLTKKYQASSLTGLPRKFKKPKNYPKGEHLELVILEGDSAMGSAEDSRDEKTQGLYPIRGKIPNAWDTPKEKFFNNEEMNGLFNLIGGAIGKGFKIENVPWEKFIIMTDADPDGADIRTLVLRALLLYALPLILDGRVYSAQPPLYGIKSKGKHKYFTTKLDFVRYIQSLFYKNNTLFSTNGSKLTNNEAIDILYKNMEYVYDLENISNTYAINPYLLEQCIINKNLSYNEFKKKIEGQYRFLNVRKENGIVLVEGLLESKIQTVVMGEKLINSCGVLSQYINNSPNNLVLNNKVTSLYGVMKIFNDSIPDNTRYKGIGEMNPEQLGETALHPDSDRTLIRYTVEDITKEIEAIRYIESNKNKLLQDVKVSKMDIM